LEESNQFKPSFDVLNLSSTNYFLEKNLSILQDTVQDYSEEQVKYQHYQRTLKKQQLALQSWTLKRKQENANRKLTGEPLLPETPNESEYFEKKNQRTKSI